MVRQRVIGDVEPSLTKICRRGPRGGGGWGRGLGPARGGSARLWAKAVVAFGRSLPTSTLGPPYQPGPGCPCFSKCLPAAPPSHHLSPGPSSPLHPLAVCVPVRSSSQPRSAPINPWQMTTFQRSIPVRPGQRAKIATGPTGPCFPVSPPSPLILSGGPLC